MDYYLIGKIVGTFGIKGELKVNASKEDFEELNIASPYYIGRDKIKVEIESSRFHKSNFLVKLKGYNNINDVISFVNSFIYIEEKDKPQLGANNYYIDDLIGLDAYSNGLLIGKVNRIESTLANDVFVIKNENKSYAIPAVHEFILNIDLTEGKVEVKLIEGMDYDI